MTTMPPPIQGTTWSIVSYYFVEDGPMNSTLFALDNFGATKYSKHITDTTEDKVVQAANDIIFYHQKVLEVQERIQSPDFPQFEGHKWEFYPDERVHSNDTPAYEYGKIQVRGFLSVPNIVKYNKFWTDRLSEEELPIVAANLVQKMREVQDIANFVQGN